MAKSSDEIEREIAQRRERLGWRLQHLQDRVQQDLHNARAAAEGEVGQAESLIDREKLQAELREHPYTVLLGGLGLGVALGAASEGRGSRNSHNGSNRRRNDSGGGLFDAAFGALGSIAGDTIQDEVRRFLHENVKSGSGKNPR